MNPTRTDSELEIVAILRLAAIQLMGCPSPGMSYREWKKKEKILNRMLWDKSVELAEGITANDIEWTRVVKDWMKDELKSREHYIAKGREVLTPRKKARVCMRVTVRQKFKRRGVTW
jgi:hypothetical protein